MRDQQWADILLEELFARAVTGRISRDQRTLRGKTARQQQSGAARGVAKSMAMRNISGAHLEARFPTCHGWWARGRVGRHKLIAFKHTVPAARATPTLRFGRCIWPVE